MSLRRLLLWSDKSVIVYLETLDMTHPNYFKVFKFTTVRCADSQNSHSGINTDLLSVVREEMFCTVTTRYFNVLEMKWNCDVDLFNKSVLLRIMCAHIGPLGHRLINWHNVVTFHFFLTVPISSTNAPLFDKSWMWIALGVSSLVLIVLLIICVVLRRRLRRSRGTSLPFQCHGLENHLGHPIPFQHQKIVDKICIYCGQGKLQSCYKSSSEKKKARKKKGK